METSQDFRGAFKVSGESAEPGCPSEAALNDPSFRQQSRSFFRFRQSDHDQFNACVLGSLRRAVARTALIGEADFDRFFCDRLHFFGQLSNLSALLLVSRCHMQREKQAERVNSYMDFAAVFSFASIISDCTFCSQQSPRRLRLPSFCKTEQRTEIMSHAFKNTGGNPPLRLLINCWPRRKIVRHHPPLSTGADKPAQSVEHLAEIMAPLRRIFFHQLQIRSCKCPILIASITWTVCSAHPTTLPKPQSS